MCRHQPQSPPPRIPPTVTSPSSVMQLALPESLPTLVAKRFTAARDASHLVFSSTHLSIINAAGISVSDVRGPSRRS
jgi:hypothetical protein